MPFPSPQGTQASIAAMLEALQSRGDAPELWTYAHGSAHEVLPYTVRRLWNVPRNRSLRSGPSLTKVLLDVQLSLRLALSPMQAPGFIAHHVEGAAACALAGRPFAFFAHTDLVGELPTYAPPRLASLLSRAGHELQHSLVQRATAIAAISPRLAQMFERTHGRPAHYVPTPWAARQPATADERDRARSHLALSPDQSVLLYAGNLDAYQGWEDVIAALSIVSRARADTVLLVATESSAAALLELAQQLGVAGHLRLAPLRDGLDRQRVHAAADLCVVPRRVEGGLPIKLLDALSRGVPIVAVPRALAGLPLENAVLATTDSAPEAIAAATLVALKDRALREALGHAGSAYLREQHSPSKFFAAFDAVFGR